MNAKICIILSIMNHPTSDSRLPKIHGLHEIHISVNPSQIALLRWYCKDKKIKPILAAALHGDHPNQLMISKYKHGLSKEVIQRAKLIAADMNKYGLDVIRIKVEAMIHCKGAPSGDEKPINDEDYWEFHLKIQLDTSIQHEQLANICSKHGSYISFNVLKREFDPLITLRLYKCSYNEAMKKKEDLINSIEKGGFVNNNEIHQELSVYDDNVELDKGWLFE